jgi:hypothetical protein
MLSGHISIMQVVNSNAHNLGIDKNNDDCRRIHLSKTNKWDAPGDVLRGDEENGNT